MSGDITMLLRSKIKVRAHNSIPGPWFLTRNQGKDGHRSCRYSREDNSPFNTAHFDLKCIANGDCFLKPQFISIPIEELLLCGRDAAELGLGLCPIQQYV
jgi:hypothetical protein